MKGYTSSFKSSSCSREEEILLIWINFLDFTWEVLIIFDCIIVLPLTELASNVQLEHRSASGSQLCRYVYNAASICLFILPLNYGGDCTLFTFSFDKTFEQDRLNRRLLCGYRFLKVFVVYCFFLREIQGCISSDLCRICSKKISSFSPHPQPKTESVILDHSSTVSFWQHPKHPRFMFLI